MKDGLKHRTVQKIFEKNFKAAFDLLITKTSSFSAQTLRYSILIDHILKDTKEEKSCSTQMLLLRASVLRILVENE